MSDKSAEMAGLRHPCVITLNRCPHGVEMLSLDCNESGARFAGPSCCGRWSEIKTWAVKANDLRDVAEMCEEYEALAAAGGAKP